MNNLLSKEQRTLFDIIDRLRSHGVGKVVDLPEIIVCGDQSAGKSSVLEALSGVPLPTKDGLCTRFVTELVLRRDQTPSVKISILPGLERSAEDAEKLHGFGDGILAGDLQDIGGFGAIIEKAKKAMGLSEMKRFSTDVLRIEISGPEQAHLTMVDLPGLFRAGSQEQSADDVETVNRIVYEAMKRPRSIILAVVSANTLFNNQEITELARKLDPKRVRTLGLITKPDLLIPGSDTEQSFLRLAQNRDVVLKLGWHVLKNRSFQMKDATVSERDKDEENFFREAPWLAVSKGSLGVKALRSRLSVILHAQILRHLPSLIQETQIRISECRDELTKLGEPRSTTSEQRRYLLVVSQKFSTLMRAAVDGNYSDPFFGDALTKTGYSRRLRAVVQNSLQAFGEQMKSSGKTHTVFEEEVLPPAVPANAISRDDYIKKVSRLMLRSRGCELPGTFNPLVIGDLFNAESEPWREILQSTKDGILKSVELAASEILAHVVVDLVRVKIGRLVDAGISRLKSRVQEQLDELLLSYSAGHPITYDNLLTETVQRIQHKRRLQRIAILKRETFTSVSLEAIRGGEQYDKSQAGFAAEMLDLLRKIEDTEPDMTTYSASLLVDFAEAYYKVALKTFIDAVSMYGIEQRLLRDLASLFTPETVFGLDDEAVGRLAADDEATITDRVKCKEMLQSLENGLTDLKSLHNCRVAVLEADVASGDEESEEEWELSSPNKGTFDKVNGLFRKPNEKLGGRDASQSETQTKPGSIFSSPAPSSSNGGSSTKPGSIFSSPVPSSSNGGSSTKPGSIFSLPAPSASNGGPSTKPGSIFSSPVPSSSNGGPLTKPGSIFSSPVPSSSNGGSSTKPGNTFSSPAPSTSNGGSSTKPGSIFSSPAPSTSNGGPSTKPASVSDTPPFKLFGISAPPKSGLFPGG